MNQNMENRKKQISIIIDEYFKQTHNMYDVSLEDLTKIAIDLYLKSNFSIQEICQRIARGEVLEDYKKTKSTKQSNNDGYEKKDEITSSSIEDIKDDKNLNTNKPIQYGHNTRVEALLLNIIPLLNQHGIDYQLAGDWVSYIKYGIDENINTSYLNIHVNEKDFDKLKKVFSILGLEFRDKRLDSQKVLKNGVPVGDSDVSAISSDEEELVQVTCFERLLDGTIIDKGYYKDENGQNCSREEIISPRLVDESFNKDKVDFQGQLIPVVAPEFTYNYYSKIVNSDKIDKPNIDVIKNYLNTDKLNKIIDYMKTDFYVQCVPVHELPVVSQINNKALENDNSELSQMLSDTVHEEKVQEKEKQKTEEKVHVKKKEIDDQSGKIDVSIIIIGILVIVALILVGLIVMTYLK